MLNSICLQGRFGNEPELKYTQSGTAVLRASLAVQRSRKDPNGDDPTDWVTCVFWGKTAETVTQHFDKGSMILIRGRLESRKWEDKNENKRTSWEIQVESFEFCEKKSSGQLEGCTSYNQSTVPEIGNSDFAELADDNDEVPF